MVVVGSSAEVITKILSPGIVTTLNPTQFTPSKIAISSLT